MDSYPCLTPQQHEPLVKNERFRSDVQLYGTYPQQSGLYFVWTVWVHHKYAAKGDFYARKQADRKNG